MRNPITTTILLCRLAATFIPPACAQDVQSSSLQSPAPSGGEDGFQMPPSISNAYTGPWRPFRMVDLTFPRADYPGLGDLDMSYAGGTLYLGLGERHVLLRGRDPFDPMGEERTAPRPFPPSPMGAYYGCLKFRNGQFFVKSGQKILRRDDANEEWALYFQADRLFSQFEILPSGKVLLVCPTDRPTTLATPGLWDLEMRCSTGNEQIPLAELYSAGIAGRPERVHAFPSALQAALRRTNGFPLVDRTFQVGNHFFLLNSQVGQIFLYDAGKGRMTLLDSPWPRFDDRHVSWVEGMGLRPPAEWGEVHVSCHGFPLKIHAYPQNERQVLFAVIMNSALDGNYASRMDAIEKSRGNRFAPLPRIYTPEERAAWSWMNYYIYDIPSGRFQACKNPRLEGLRLDFTEHWVKVSGEAIPLRKLGLAGPE